MNDQLLSEFMTGFYGYGNFAGRYWFIGMEEGGGSSASEIAQRLSLWASRGKKELEDLTDYHVELGVHRYFKEPVEIQKTWKHLIRVILSAEKQRSTLEDIKRYQRDQLGRLSGDTCLLELMPLPSRSTGDWIYSQFSNLPVLNSRKQYQKQCAPLRVHHVRQRIAAYHPPVVVFYSFNAWYRQWWESISGIELALMQTDERLPYFSGRDTHTRYFIIRHPVSIGITNNYYHWIGKELF